MGVEEGEVAISLHRALSTEHEVLNFTVVRYCLAGHMSTATRRADIDVNMTTGVLRGTRVPG
jgi:hypothetical protein